MAFMSRQVISRTYWQEKMENRQDLPRVERIPERMESIWGFGTLVIPSPKEVDAIMKRVPLGKVITINDIRAFLAKKHEATIGCPMTTGIFVGIAAHAADEARRAGVSETTPYWRTLKEGGAINEKYPGGVAVQKRLLEREGHRVVKKGVQYFVEDFQGSMALARRPRGRPPH